MKNPFRRFFRKGAVVRHSAPTVDQTRGNTALVVYDPKFVYGKLADVERLTHLLDVLRFERSAEACHQFIEFLGWKLEHGMRGRKILSDGTDQFVSVYSVDDTDKLIDDLVVIGEDMLDLFKH